MEAVEELLHQEDGLLPVDEGGGLFTVAMVEPADDTASGDTVHADDDAVRGTDIALGTHSACSFPAPFEASPAGIMTLFT